MLLLSAAFTTFTVDYTPRLFVT